FSPLVTYRTILPFTLSCYHIMPGEKKGREGNRTVYLYIDEAGKSPKAVNRLLSKPTQHIGMTEGGSAHARCAHNRIKQAFFTEEEIAVKVLKAKAQSRAKVLLYLGRKPVRMRKLITRGQ
uniref:Large ribosomal subunit protein eL34 n=1 Tax=Dromaius novaehollandiae TaxID=8790 RepID=A0A8C4JB71_DRONO